MVPTDIRERLLTAAVAGYEIGPRVGMCMGQEHIGQGWHSGATVGVFSAAAGAARALNLTEEETVHALGIAGTAPMLLPRGTWLLRRGLPSVLIRR